MSTDSITTVRGANTPDASLTDLRITTPASAPTSSSSRIPFPLNIPSLAQAQTVLKGIFRSQAQNDSQSATNSSFSASSGSLVRPSVAKPIRVSETASRSGDRDSGITKHHTHHNEHVLSGNDAHSKESRSPISDDEDSEADLIAKANAEYNAAASKAGSADPPASQEPSTFTATHQVYNAPATHHATATIQSTRNVAPEANPWYLPSTATRPSGSIISHTSDHRTSPEQAYMYAPQQPIPQPRSYTTVPSSGERASKYVSSASTRGTSTSPPRTRQDSTTAFNNGLSARSSNVETSNTLTPAQGRPQQDMRIRQGSLYEPQNSQIDDTRNPHGREYGSRLETDRVMTDLYSRTSERQASYVSNAYPQRGSATTVTSSSSASARGRPETPVISDPLQIPFPAPVRESQRRYSDGDTSVASQPIYGAAHASTSGANVLPNVLPGPGVASTVTEALRTTELESQRRYSDGESNIPDRAPLTLFRTVRWNENLICPSPIFPHQRRKGWFNRRGDQLWTNDGAYKPPAQGQEYPPDLDGYPEHGDGWMNEQGVRIDIAHRLIPKVPLKSALKTSRPQPTTVQQEN
ncbi:hypothetical protein C0993_005230 [Termitomyces sp. T159_Od127]|nr:hypothetical protein C0993_005230 [Termitomyces sp. T159_Od127]